MPVFIAPQSRCEYNPGRSFDMIYEKVVMLNDRVPCALIKGPGTIKKNKR